MLNPAHMIAAAATISRGLSGGVLSTATTAITERIAGTAPSKRRISSPDSTHHVAIEAATAIDAPTMYASRRSLGVSASRPKRLRLKARLKAGSAIQVSTANAR